MKKSDIEINVYGGNVEILPNVTSAVQVFNQHITNTCGTKPHSDVTRQILKADIEKGGSFD